MLVVPAIDLRAGRVVRLVQGAYDAERRYDLSPVEVAQAFVRQGARWIHVVDLDGARAGSVHHLEEVAAICAAVRGQAAVEFGGGIRSREAAQAVLAAGVEALVLGTAALRQVGLVAELLGRYGPERVAVALDARDGKLRVAGWLEAAEQGVREATLALARLGVRRVIFTDTGRDGTLQGPNLAALEELRGLGVQVWAAGGIRSLEDIRALAGLGFVAGAVVGRALYEGALDLGAAIAAAGCGGGESI